MITNSLEPFYSKKRFSSNGALEETINIYDDVEENYDTKHFAEIFIENAALDGKIYGVPKDWDVTIHSSAKISSSVNSNTLRNAHKTQNQRFGAAALRFSVTFASLHSQKTRRIYRL